MIRRPIVDGIFYPFEATALRTQIKTLLEKADVSPSTSIREPLILVVPHAAYRYCGELIARAFCAAAGRNIQTVFVLGPIHHDPIEGVFLPESSVFQTPMGDAEVSRKIVAKLVQQDPLFQSGESFHLEEHCIEVQLPFIQYLFPDSTIVPMLFGNIPIELICRLSRILHLTIGDSYGSILIIVTSNMQVLLKGRDASEQIEKLADVVVRADSQGILRMMENNLVDVCGLACLAAVLSLPDRSFSAHSLGKTESALIDGDTRNSIHYQAFSIFSKQREEVRRDGL